MTEKEKELYKLKADILKTVAHPIRLAIIDFLESGEKSVNDIIRWTGGSQSNVSKHLSILRKVGIIDDRKEGLNRFYYLKIPCVTNFSTCVTETLKDRIKQDRKIVIL